MLLEWNERFVFFTTSIVLYMRWNLTLCDLLDLVQCSLLMPGCFLWWYQQLKGRVNSLPFSKILKIAYLSRQWSMQLLEMTINPCPPLIEWMRKTSLRTLSMCGNVQRDDREVNNTQILGSINLWWRAWLENWFGESGATGSTNLQIMIYHTRFLLGHHRATPNSIYYVSMRMSTWSWSKKVEPLTPDSEDTVPYEFFEVLIRNTVRTRVCLSDGSWFPRLDVIQTLDELDMLYEYLEVSRSSSL